MLDEDTKRKLRQLNLGSAVEVYEEQEKLLDMVQMPFDERFRLFIDTVHARQNDAKIKRMRKAAHLRNDNANLIDFFATGNRGITQSEVNQLRALYFMNCHASLIIEGPSGSGKTWLSNAVANQALILQKRVIYFRMPDMLDAYREASYSTEEKTKFLKKLSRYDLLIIDEWLLYPPSKEEVYFILELLERRYTEHSTVFCSQYAVSEWHERLLGGLQADAILDRIVHNSIILKMGPENMRAFKR